MKKYILLAFVCLFCCNAAYAQDDIADTFAPICKYMEQGECDRLSAWFADNLELDILGAVNNCSRNQARLIMRNFFSNYTPKHLEIIHRSGKAPMKYAVGTLDAGGEKFQIIFYVKADGDKSYIEQLKISRQ